MDNEIKLTEDKEYTQADTFHPSPVWICVFTQAPGNTPPVTVTSCCKWYLLEPKRLAIPGSCPPPLQFATSNNAGDRHVIGCQPHCENCHHISCVVFLACLAPRGRVDTGSAKPALKMGYLFWHKCDKMFPPTPISPQTVSFTQPVNLLEMSSKGDLRWVFCFILSGLMLSSRGNSSPRATSRSF